MKIRSKNKFFISLLTILITFIVIILISIFILYFNGIERRIKTINNQYNENLLTNSKSSVEDYLYSINQMGNQIYTNSSILNLINNIEDSSSSEKVSLMDWLTQLKYSTSNIHSISLYINDENKIYDTNYGYAHFSNYPDQGWIKETKKNNKKKLLSIDYRDFKGSYYDPSFNKEVINFIYLLPPFSSSSNRLNISVDIKGIYDNIIGRLHNNSDFYFGIINKDGTLLTGRDDNDIFTNLEARSYIKYSAQKQVYNVKDKNSTYTITQLPSESFPLNFIWIDSKMNIKNILIETRTYLIVGVLLIGIFVIIFALFITRKTTSSMDEIIQLIDYQSNNILFMDDFKNYITETFNENSIMNEKLEVVSNIYTENIIYKLLDNKNITVPDCLEQLEKFDVSFKKTYSFVICIEIVNIFSLEENNINLNKIKEEIRKISTNLFHTKDILTYSTNIKQDTIAIIINTDHEDWIIGKWIIEEFYSAVLSIKTNSHNVRASVGISDKTRDISHIRALYHQSIKSLQYRDLKADRNIIYFADLVKFNKYKYFSLTDGDFEADLLMGKRDVCINNINTTLNELEARKTVLKSEFEGVVRNYISISLRIAFKTNINISNNQYLNGNIVNLTLSIKTIYSAKKILDEMITYICTEINALHSDKDCIYLNKILKYIDENYTKNLSMDDVSEATNLSTSYIYKIMKRNTQMTFVEYLTDKKISKACKLLSTDMKVKDVAKEVGFSNSKYFISVFKKKTGVLPTIYKNGIKS